MLARALATLLCGALPAAAAAADLGDWEAPPALRPPALRSARDEPAPAAALRLLDLEQRLRAVERERLGRTERRRRAPEDLAFELDLRRVDARADPGRSARRDIERAIDELRFRRRTARLGRILSAREGTRSP